MKAIFQFQKEGHAHNPTVFVGIDNTIGDMTLDNLVENNIAGMRQERIDFKLIESKPSTLLGFTAHEIVYSKREIKVSMFQPSRTTLPIGLCMPLIQRYTSDSCPWRSE